MDVNPRELQMNAVIATGILGSKTPAGSQALICFVNLDILFDVSRFMLQVSLLKDVKLSSHPTS